MWSFFLRVVEEILAWGRIDGEVDKRYGEEKGELFDLQVDLCFSLHLW